jgi:flagellar basal-body rod protein FlgC
MNLFGLLDLSGSAMTAERERAEVVTSNMANAETTRTPQGGPYRRQLVVFRAQRFPRFPMLLASAGGGLPSLGSRAARGVEVDQVVADPSPVIQRYQPGHPDADAKGYVSYPNINPVEEMADLLGAVRSYQLNAAAVQAAKSMITESLDILR